MDEIVKLVAKKANISEPIAKIAVETVLSFVKTKLPKGAEGIIDSLTGSTSSKSSSKSKNDDALGGLGNVLSGLGGLLGGKK